MEIQEEEKSLLSDEEREKIRRQYVNLVAALHNYIKDFDHRIPVDNFVKLSLPLIKDLKETKYEHNHDCYAKDLCTMMHTIKDKLKEFQDEILKAISELREVCHCGL